VIEPIAYLTAEVKHRDLDSRVLIASHLLKAGYPVIVGQQWTLFMNAEVLPPAVVLFKTVNEIQASNMANFRRCGHLVAATDEEVLVCIEDQCFTMVFGQKAANNCDIFFAQSRPHAQAVVRKYPALADKVIVTGNARVDLMAQKGRSGFAADAAALRRDVGPFVLFNMNYGVINSIWPDLNAVIQINARAGAFDPKDPASVNAFKGLIDWERKNLAEMVPLVHWAAKNIRDRKVVIRPHPVERAEFWQKEMADYDNVIIVPRSQPHPWILAADVVVHTGCTTGLEATLMNRPAVNVMPSKNPVFDLIVNYVNPTFSTWQEAAPAIDAFLATGRGPIQDAVRSLKPAVEQYFPDYEDGVSCQRIAEELIKVMEANGAAKPSSSFELALREPGLRPCSRPATLKDKFTVSLQEIGAAITKMRPLSGYEGNPRIATLDDSLFLLLP